VLLNPVASTNLVIGSFAQATTAVPQFMSMETLTVPASGQSRVTATDGFLNGVMFTLQGGFTFGDLIFALNPQNGPPNNTDFRITANGTSTTQTLTGSVATGNQFFTITTSGETISTVLLQSTVGFDNVQQFRVSAITAPGGGGGGGGGQIPEPSTLAMLAGGVGLLVLGRKWK